MKDLGINLQVHYIPIHTQPFYRDNYKINSKDYKFAQKFYEHEVSLPIYPNLSIKDRLKVIGSLIKVLNEG